MDARPAHQPRGMAIEVRLSWAATSERCASSTSARTLVSLDLAALHRDNGEWPELEVIAADTYQRFRRLSGNTEAVAALSLCVTAARDRRGVDAAIASAQEIITARMAQP